VRVSRVRPGDSGLEAARSALVQIRAQAKRKGIDKLPLREINRVVEEVRAEMRAEKHGG
jgi:hypothetical protein